MQHYLSNYKKGVFDSQPQVIEGHYGAPHTALWSCTHIPNIIDLSGKTKKVMVQTSFAEKKRKRKKKKKSD
jgi:hypothetical protein